LARVYYYTIDRPPSSSDPGINFGVCIPSPCVRVPTSLVVRDE